MKESIIKPNQYQLNTDAFGHVKIWRFRPGIGYKELLLNKRNIIVNQGADVMANALAGKPNSAINYFYVGYTTNASTDNVPAVTDTCASFGTTDHHGFLRLPLAFPPSFLNETGFSNNVPYFTTFITSGSGTYQHGAAFANGVTLTTLGLVNAPVSSDLAQDLLFAKINIGAITYDSSYGLAITWGVTFRTVSPS